MSTTGAISSWDKGQDDGKVYPLQDLDADRRRSLINTLQSLTEGADQEGVVIELESINEFGLKDKDFDYKLGFAHGLLNQ